jgi:hypothetical protein
MVDNITNINNTYHYSGKGSRLKNIQSIVSSSKWPDICFMNGIVAICCLTGRRPSFAILRIHKIIFKTNVRIVNVGYIVHHCKSFLLSVLYKHNLKECFRIQIFAASNQTFVSHFYRYGCMLDYTRTSSGLKRRRFLMQLSKVCWSHSRLFYRLCCIFGSNRNWRSLISFVPLSLDESCSWGYNWIVLY